MKITLVSVATALVFLMGVHGHPQPQKDFDLQRFAGKWYRVGLAYDSPGFVPYRDKLRVSMGMLTPQTNGNVNLTMWSQRILFNVHWTLPCCFRLPSDDSCLQCSSGCRSKLYTYEKTATPGAFTYFSTRHNKEKDITVVETNYNQYALVLKHKNMDREYTQVALYGRSQKLKPDVLQKFRDFATSQGFPKDAIMTPTLTENCPPSKHKTRRTS
uniref:Lipocalin/cytosolic fatty-acid binding domain-containing protein n=1 Tax=Esox lucius TaxID=8010 RepID=A0AAY5LAM0_ESOLU